MLVVYLPCQTKALAFPNGVVLGVFGELGAKVGLHLLQDSLVRRVIVYLPFVSQCIAADRQARTFIFFGALCLVCQAATDE
ncbi:hypothetical protein D9M69_714180 [compost metagenome]